MDLRKLKTLIDLVSESNVSELEITEAEGKVRIVKGGGAAGAPVVQTAVAAPVVAAAPVLAAAPAAEAPAAAAAPAGHMVKAPSLLWRWATPSSRAKPSASSRR
jgi:acetyl-CoA carboxylase biotin carboxyl carrier protein